MDNNRRIFKFLAMFLSVYLVLTEIGCFCNFTLAADAATKVTGTVTASSLNVRKGAGTSYGLLTKGGSKVLLTKGDKVTILSTKSSWYYVSFTYKKATLKGYVLSKYVKKDTTETNIAAKTTAGGLYVRKGPGTSYDYYKVGGKNVKLVNNTSVTIKKTTGSWYYISFKYSGATRYGYVSSKYVKKNSATTTSLTNIAAKTTANKLNVRTGPATSFSILKVNKKNVVLTKNTSVTIKKTTGSWYYISFKYSNATRYGYVTSEYVKKVTATSATATSATATPKPVATKTPTAVSAATSGEKPSQTTTSGNDSGVYPKEAKVSVDSSLNVRKGAGTAYDILSIGDQNVRLIDDTTVTLLKKVGNWYFISFMYNSTTYTGYVYEDYISLSVSKINHGVDVSRWQEEINWKKVAADGISFAFIRIGYRAKASGNIIEDSYAKENIEGALAVGINVGVYFFSSAVNTTEAKEEAAWVCNYISKYKITYPVVFDYEAYNNPEYRCYGVSYSTRTALATTFLNYVEAKGYTPMMYGSKNALENEWNMSLLSQKYKTWVAHYTANSYTSSMSTSYKGNYSIWQYTESGSVDGIPGKVDRNVEYVN